MARLWDKGLPLDERILRFTAGEDHRLDERLVEYDARASIAHARMLEKQKLLERRPTAMRSAMDSWRWPPRTPPGNGRSSSPTRTRTAHSSGGSPSASARPAAACISAARATIRCSSHCGSICATRSTCSRAKPKASSRRSSASQREQGAVAPARLHAHATGDAELRGAVGAGFRHRAQRRSRRLAARAEPHGAEPARLRGRLRCAEPAARPRGDARRAWASSERRSP